MYLKNLEENQISRAVANQVNGKVARRPKASFKGRMVQLMNYNLRDRTPKTTQVKGVPEGYLNLNDFDKATSFRYALASRVGNPTEIFAKLFNDKVFLWWSKPAKQVDEFVYFGDRADDIKHCNSTYGSKSDYTWHHTGYPQEESYGTMQLVPTEEHDALPHYGGVYISKGEF